jgi:hypothetical protein
MDIIIGKWEKEVHFILTLKQYYCSYVVSNLSFHSKLKEIILKSMKFRLFRHHYSVKSMAPEIYAHHVVDGLKYLPTCIHNFVAWPSFQKFQTSNFNEMPTQSSNEWWHFGPSLHA